MTDEHVVRLDAWREAGLSGTFEAALDTLDHIVAYLEVGRHGLDETVAAYELGVSVAKRCESLLASAELRVSQITIDAEFARRTLPVEIDTEDESSDDETDEPPF